MDAVIAQERRDQVRAQWDRTPWHSEFSTGERLSREFYLDVERQRYALQPHILEILSWIDWRGKRVLEVGAGVGTDARRIIGAGALYTGINVDRGSTEATAQALRAFSLPGVALERDAKSLDFPDGAFDVVYSFGVLQHIPEGQRAVAEIHRVLKPGGEFLLMLYNRTSINYALEIKFLRKLGLRLLRLPGMIPLLARLGLPRAKLQRHLQIYLERGSPSEEEWLGRNTNGPDYPYCRVYDAHEARQLLAGFGILFPRIPFFYHPPRGGLGPLLPGGVRPPLGRGLGGESIVARAHAPAP